MMTFSFEAMVHWNTTRWSRSFSDCSRALAVILIETSRKGNTTLNIHLDLLLICYGLVLSRQWKRDALECFCVCACRPCVLIVIRRRRTSHFSCHQISFIILSNWAMVEISVFQAAVDLSITKQRIQSIWYWWWWCFTILIDNASRHLFVFSSLFYYHNWGETNLPVESIARCSSTSTQSVKLRWWHQWSEKIVSAWQLHERLKYLIRKMISPICCEQVNEWSALSPPSYYRQKNDIVQLDGLVPVWSRYFSRLVFLINRRKTNERRRRRRRGKRRKMHFLIATSSWLVSCSIIKNNLIYSLIQCEMMKIISCSPPFGTSVSLTLHRLFFKC